MSAKKTKSSTTLEPNKNNVLDQKYTDLVPPPKQAELFKVEKQAEVDGVEMGVLENGVPYLTESGLSRMCGINRKGLNNLATDWRQERQRPRGKKITELLRQSGYTENSLFIQIENKGTQIKAYSEPVCLALLEYYAFVVDDPREQAIRAFRTLARKSFRSFIYDAVGYHPDQTKLDSWRHFHDRVDMTMDSVPLGYFSVFREISSMIVPMIRSNIIISDKVVPDISVGITWSKFWKDRGLEKYGDRVQYDHEYPLYYPQAKSNPQPAFAYPDEILGIFRAWLRREYITSRLPAYLTRQAGKGAVSANVATKVIESFSSLTDETAMAKEVELVHPTYQPSKAELEEDAQVDATLDEAVKALVKPVKVHYVKPMKGPVRNS